MMGFSFAPQPRLCMNISCRRLALFPLVAYGLTYSLIGHASHSACIPKGVDYFHEGATASTQSAHSPTHTEGALLLMGGGDRSFSALRWFFAKAGHGRIVVLSASYGAEIGKQFYRQVGGIQAVDTLVFHDRQAAFNACVQQMLVDADGIFIAGGDQARYVRYWKDTPVAGLLDMHVRSHKPLAGTSAGLAILGEALYGDLDDDSLTSEAAAADPLGPGNTLVREFLHLPLLASVITDTHFTERHRLTRLLAFMVKDTVVHPGQLYPLRGLGIDEAAAIAVEADGSSHVYTEHPNAGAWWVANVAWQPNNTLNGLTARVAHLGTASSLHLPDGQVSAPLGWFTARIYDNSLTLSPLSTVLPDRVTEAQTHQ